ncbi:ParA family protein (plasmid) [Nocardia sp. NBC_01503]|uniref:ParA family protein n=1 Tax=Nocardia sp. NBC_01503 TaxID=2975997 RepID=UPI002E7AC56C|nr:ParA family protein [Nocardia sp. NBC_01503]WTL36701.1 ParA family protein [Nocardia sp. NBC_01503]WTL36746.1 ParA family protein [Nocardia sp. NBC_01503]
MAKKRAEIRVLLNQKGGVGKSTTSMNLAATTADTLTGGNVDAESETALVSIDPQGSVLWWGNQVPNLPFHLVQSDYDRIDLLRALPNSPTIKHFFVDTPGWIGHTGTDNDPVAGLPFAEALHAILDVATQVIVPIEPEPLGFDPTARTIERLLKPRGLDYRVVINNWDPRDGKSDLEQTQDYVRANGWPLAKTVIRHYKLNSRAPADGQVVTTYPKNRTGVECRLDYSKLALELNIGGGH